MDTLMIVGIILFIAGFILIAVEMVVPGFGAPGISGIACLVIGLFLTADTIEEGAFITVIVLALLAIMMAIILWMLSKGKIHSPIILEEEQKKDEGYISSVDLDYLLGKKGLRKRI
ncbi:MAG: hypothetical protein ACLVLH_16250 [Eisenbergiella massiliensis]